MLATGGSGNIENSYSDASYAYGKRAYDLNSYYRGTSVAYPDYLSDYFADGSWRYGYTTANGGWRLTEHNGEPNYANQWGNRRSMQLDGKPEDVGDHSGLYFGQRLASVGADAYPVRVTEANRVYRAAGYYGSKVKDGFWFNKVAEVYNPSITAIDFTDAEMLDLPEDAVTGLTSFAVRSNSDNEHRDRVTKNLLVYTPTDCGTLFNGLHYQAPVRLYNTNDDEDDIKGHHLMRGADNAFHPYGNLFHLVDKQDFNAPIEFRLSGDNALAWYIRKPTNYSRQNNAWEGICLPFTVNSVYAFNGSDRTSRGYITHFYDDDVRGHDYWLRGFTGVGTADGKTSLDFSRLGAATNLFSQNRIMTGSAPEVVADYEHLNRWFETAYNNPMYDLNYSHGGSGTVTTYNSYRYLTANVPYIISFPGIHYYEYDLNGEFYTAVYNGTDPAEAQTILYMYRPTPLAGDEYSCSVAKGDATGELRVGITDDCDKVTAISGYRHCGTFAYLSATSALTIEDDVEHNVPGKVFKQAGGEVLPFRTYVTASASPAPQLLIGAGADESKPEDQEMNVGPTDGLRIYPEAHDLIIESNKDLCLPLFDLDGRMVTMLTVKSGVNRYKYITPGIYIVAGTKFKI